MIPLLLAAVLAVPAQPVTALGAAALTDTTIDWASVTHVDNVTPAAVDAPADVPEHHSRGCMDGFTADGGLIVCTDGPDDAPTVMLVGDSKLLQWSPAIVPAALAAGWRVETLYFPACPYTDAVVNHGDEVFAECVLWNELADDYIAAHPPELFITTSGRRVALEADGRSTVTALVDGYVSRWTALNAFAPVVVIADNPAPPFHVYECVAANPTAIDRCSFDYRTGLAASGAPTERAAAALVPGVSIIDLNGSLCPGLARCPAVIGDVLIYRQGSHLTDTYVETMAPIAAEALTPFL